MTSPTPTEHACVYWILSLAPQRVECRCLWRSRPEEGADRRRGARLHGTRGVLRVLAFAVKPIWESEFDTASIHTCHLDTTNPNLIGEILSMTESGDLMYVLTADVGAVRGHRDTLIFKSNAEKADQENPHPSGLPMQVYTRRTVFLHSLVGRHQGIGSKLFGLV